MRLNVMRLKSDKEQNNAYIILAFKRIFRAIQRKPSFDSSNKYNKLN